MKMFKWYVNNFVLTIAMVLIVFEGNVYFQRGMFVYLWFVGILMLLGSAGVKEMSSARIKHYASKHWVNAEIWYDTAAIVFFGAMGWWWTMVCFVLHMISGSLIHFEALKYHKTEKSVNKTCPTCGSHPKHLSCGDAAIGADGK